MSMNTLLVPLDGSALAELVLPYVRLLAPLMSADVWLLGVVSDTEIERLLAYESVRLQEGPAEDMSTALRKQRARNQLCAHARDYLERQVEQLRVAGLKAQFAVRMGAPEDQINSMAERCSATLIVMATHGYGGLKRWALGSVADKVVQAATTPILLIRSALPEHSPKLRRMMVPLDGSALALQAMSLAIELATVARAELILFQAIAPVVEAYPYPPLPSCVQLALRDQACAEFTRLAESLREHQLTITPAVELGFPGEAIVDAAARRDVDLIVMATHGYGGLKRWALGSVADKLLHATQTPLLLIRSQLHDQAECRQKSFTDAKPIHA
jgi:nucleotide-binding universal stress UspA family protein